MKDIQILVDKIAKRIENAMPGKHMSPIEIDILLDHLRQTYIQVELLKKQEEQGYTERPYLNGSDDDNVNHVIQVTEPPVIEEPTTVEPPAAVTDKPEFDVHRVIDPQPFMPSPPPVIEEPVRVFNHQVPEINVSEQSANEQDAQRANQVKARPITGDLFSNTTVADKLKSDSTSLKEKLTQGLDDNSLAHKMQLKPIADLKTAIGINDKFQFINDLFEGRIELYNDAIQRLNSCGTAIMADVVFSELKSKYNWNEQGEAFNKLHLFIARRYL